MTQMTSDITTLLRTRHKLQSATNDFTIRNNSDLLSTVTSVSQTMTYLLGAWRRSRWWWAASGS